MASKADKTVTQFPTMGTSAATSWSTASRTPDRTTSMPKKHGKGGMLEAATANHRTPIHERHGAKFAPQTTMSYSNASEASATMANARIVPSAVGNRDFWAKRAHGQVS